MRFICERIEKISEQDEQFLNALNIIIIHKTKLAPIYIIEASDISIINKSNFFDSVEISPTYTLADDVTMTPDIKSSTLIKKACVGWGSIRVAVFDSGVRPDNANLVFSHDYTPYGFIMSNHGTIVAKIINNYSPAAQIYSMKIAHEGNDIDGSNILIAFDKALELEVDIINMSLGREHDCRNTPCKVCNYVNYIVEEGITVVAASGNSGKKDGYSIDCPANVEKAITVGSVVRNMELARSSGKGVPGFNKPNIVAPGHVSTTVKVGKNTVIEREDGTSFAAPVISGVLASLFSVFKERDIIITNMYNNCEDLGLQSYEQGFGYINVEKLLEVCENDATISRKSSGQTSN